MSIEFNHKYLTVMMEECAEVIQAASKCQRFGMEDFFPDYNGGRTNEDQMFIEIGDLLGVLDVAMPGWKDHPVVHLARTRKPSKLAKYGPEGSYKGVGND